MAHFAAEHQPTKATVLARSNLECLAQAVKAPWAPDSSAAPYSSAALPPRQPLLGPRKLVILPRGQVLNHPLELAVQPS